MKKKYNNNSQFFKDWTTTKLKAETKDYDNMINNLGCYGISDLKFFYGCVKELERRGIEINSEITFN